MAKNISKLFFACVLMLSLTSCYTYSFNVGNGAQSGVTIQEKNHYFIYGLAQGKQADFEELAGGSKDYRVTIKHTFVDGLINAITFGIYTPTTTIVQK